MLNKGLHPVWRRTEVALRYGGEGARVLGEGILNFVPDEVYQRLLPLVGLRELSGKLFHLRTDASLPFITP